jgi:hypothetical protein
VSLTQNQIISKLRVRLEYAERVVRASIRKQKGAINSELERNKAHQDLCVAIVEYEQHVANCSIDSTGEG